MFFLLRAAFWLTIVLALLPTGSSHTTAQGPQVSEAISAAGATVADLRDFCTRRPEACEVGSQVAVLIGQRAQAGAKMLYELINEHGGPSDTGSLSSAKSENAKSESTATPAPDTAKGVPMPIDRTPIGRGTERR
jgi:hypothetical protein